MSVTKPCSGTRCGVGTTCAWLGFFQTFPTPGHPHCITDVIDLAGPPVDVFVNVDGVSEHACLTFEFLDERFYPIAGYSGSGSDRVEQPGLQ